MPELKNPRWEKFCQFYVELGSGSEAYRRSGYHVRSPQVASADSARLLAIDSIKQRITHLRAMAVFKTEMKREELAGYYAAVIKTPVGEVHEHHPLAQAVEITDKGTKVRLPDKNAAAAQLARLAGWEAAQRVELQVDNPLTAYLRELRAKPTEVQAIEDINQNETKRLDAVYSEPNEDNDSDTTAQGDGIEHVNP